MLFCRLSQKFLMDAPFDFIKCAVFVWLLVMYLIGKACTFAVMFAIKVIHCEQLFLLRWQLVLPLSKRSRSHLEVES